MKCLCITVTLISLTGVLAAAWSDAPAKVRKGSTGEVRPAVDEARRQARVLHSAMHSMLQTVHDRYYREDEGLPIPAAVFKLAFAELEKEHKVSLRWLAVDGQAMNTDHLPQNAFETEAVAALKSNQQEFERVENDIYRHAGAITLSNHCLKCHVPDRKSTEDRTAGLIISIPVGK